MSASVWLTVSPLELTRNTKKTDGPETQVGAEHSTAKQSSTGVAAPFLWEIGDWRLDTLYLTDRFASLLACVVSYILVHIIHTYSSILEVYDTSWYVFLRVHTTRPPISTFLFTLVLHRGVILFVRGVTHLCCVVPLVPRPFLRLQLCNNRYWYDMYDT